MPLLYYWRPDNYARDRGFGFGYHLNQNNALLTSMREGDGLWAFTRRRIDGLYVLAGELIVRAVISRADHDGGFLRLEPFEQLHRRTLGVAVPDLFVPTS